MKGYDRHENSKYKHTLLFSSEFSVQYVAQIEDNARRFASFEVGVVSEGGSSVVVVLRITKEAVTPNTRVDKTVGGCYLYLVGTVAHGGV